MMIFMAAPALAAPSCEADKAGPARTKVVRQADGSVVERLAMVAIPQTQPSPLLAPSPAGASDKSSKGRLAERVEGLVELIESVVEPRAMTALATVPVAGGAEGENLSEWVDPEMVRNWAEFVDPALALRWKVFVAGKGFSQAVMLRAEDGGRIVSVEKGGTAMPRGAARAGSLPSTTWRNAVSEGAKRALTGQQALQEWLVLPMPEPKANPWLTNLDGYRY